MIVDIIKSIYLFLFRISFMWMNRKPLQDKIVLFVTFPQNAYYLTEELKKRDPSLQIILICNESSHPKMAELKNEQIQLLELHRHKHYLTRIYNLATAKIIIVDNYFPFLAVTNFKKEVRCIQIWHAAGAIKSFGLDANNTTTRTAISKRRFHRVYNRFDKIVVGSEEMAEIFTRAFNVSSSSFLRTGVPRTDLFFDEHKKQQIRNKFYRDHPHAKGKRVILYAPTFRDTESNNLPLDFKQLTEVLGPDMLVLVKLHPVTKQNFAFPAEDSGRLIHIDADEDVNEWLVITDLLITDYSSIPFEFCLLNKPMVFYAYDLEEYIAERGIWENYEAFVPGPVVFTQEQLEAAILATDHSMNDQRVVDFCETWNRYSQGKSSEQLIDYVIKKVT